MWSVGISISPTPEAEVLGFDAHQFNRILIRVAQYFLDKDMRVVFGHDWQNEGVMQAVVNFAGRVSPHRANAWEFETDELFAGEQSDLPPRMLNVVPTKHEQISKHALEAERNNGGVVRVLPLHDLLSTLPSQGDISHSSLQEHSGDSVANELTQLRVCLTALLNPGCRICIGGITQDYQGKEPDIKEEAKLALKCQKPLYLMGGFGGATSFFGEEQKQARHSYWETSNGLTSDEKEDLFETLDLERAIRLIAQGIENQRNSQNTT